MIFSAKRACALFAFLCALYASAAAQSTDIQTFTLLLQAPHRTPTNVARDPYRHPAQTLAFFGIRPDSTVVEILPGSAGYYMEILAPWLREKGQYIAANRDGSQPQFMADHQKLLDRLAKEPTLYDKVRVVPFRADRHAIAPAGTVDAVISFRNLHNWMDQGELQETLKTFFLALKPGGVLGIVDHRGRQTLSQEAQIASGYVREDLAIALIEKAGFKLQAKSEVNANPKDTKDYPEGVWSLPPVYRLKDIDREKYAAIGEGDRFTLRFIKP